MAKRLMNELTELQFEASYMIRNSGDKGYYLNSIESRMKKIEEYIPRLRVLD